MSRKWYSIQAFLLWCHFSVLVLVLVRKQIFANIGHDTIRYDTTEEINVVNWSVWRFVTLETLFLTNHHCKTKRLHWKSQPKVAVKFALRKLQHPWNYSIVKDKSSIIEMNCLVSGMNSLRNETFIHGLRQRYINKLLSAKFTKWRVTLSLEHWQT